MNLFPKPSATALEARRKRLLKATARGGTVFILLRAIAVTVWGLALKITMEVFVDHDLRNHSLIMQAAGSFIIGIVMGIALWLEAESFLLSDKGRASTSEQITSASTTE